MALAEGTVLTESMALAVCGWTDKLPASCRETADEILVTAARHGARKDDLAALAAEIYARSLPDQPDDDRQLSFEDRKAPGGDHLRWRGRDLRGSRARSARRW